VQRVIVYKPGGWDALKVESGHAVPSPGPGEVRVAVQAIGVNFADVIVRLGLYESAKVYGGYPITPGFEVAGVVDAVGSDVTEWKRGDEVMAVTRFGAYASAVVVPAGQVFRRPKGFGVLEAAAFPAVHLTAWYALRELVRLHPGMSVLVHSAAGGVGGALVQLARASECRVVGVVGSTGKVEQARALGCHAVIDKSAGDLWPAAERESPEGYDVICDANGIETLRQSYRHLAPAGRLVVYGFHTMFKRDPRGGRVSWLKLAIDWLRTPRFSPLKMTTENRSVLALNLSFLFPKTDLFRAAMAELLADVEAGRLRRPQVTPFPLAHVADAHRALESGRTTGKLVLTVTA
jgi:synaptic vesicle membrane protein VAT-1